MRTAQDRRPLPGEEPTGEIESLVYERNDLNELSPELATLISSLSFLS